MPEREGQQVDREVGRTKDAGFQIGVSRTVPHDAAAVWELLTSSVGLAVWLGELTEPHGSRPAVRHHQRDPQLPPYRSQSGCLAVAKRDLRPQRPDLGTPSRRVAAHGSRANTPGSGGVERRWVRPHFLGEAMR